jgi:hypothetical protein
MPGFGNRYCAMLFAVATLAIGFSYWQLPYNRIALPHSLFDVGMVLVVAFAVLLRAAARCSFRETLLASAAAFPAAVLLRIIFDTFSDSTSHNLWPFELVIATVFGAIVGALGAALGGAVATLREKGAD